MKCYGHPIKHPPIEVLVDGVFRYLSKVMQPLPNDFFWANTNPKNLYTFSPNFPRFVKIVEISTNPMMHRTKLWKNLLLSPLTGSSKLRIIRLKEIIFLNYLKLVASGFASRVYFHLTKLTNDEGWYLIDLSLIKTNINFTNTE